MNITIHRKGRAQQVAHTRIADIATRAGQLITARLGGRLPHTDIVLTDAKGVASHLHHNDTRLVGGISRTRRLVDYANQRWTAHHAYAATTITAHGALIAINCDHHRGDHAELDRTLLHELAHAVQLNQPGARNRHITYLRQQLGIDKHHPADQRAYEQLMNTRE